MFRTSAALGWLPPRGLFGVHRPPGRPRPARGDTSTATLQGAQRGRLPALDAARLIFRRTDHSTHGPPAGNPATTPWVPPEEKNSVQRSCRSATRRRHRAAPTGAAAPPLHDHHEDRHHDQDPRRAGRVSQLRDVRRAAGSAGPAGLQCTCIEQSRRCPRASRAPRIRLGAANDPPQVHRHGQSTPLSVLDALVRHFNVVYHLRRRDITPSHWFRGWAAPRSPLTSTASWQHGEWTCWGAGTGCAWLAQSCRSRWFPRRARRRPVGIASAMEADGLRP